MRNLSKHKIMKKLIYKIIPVLIVGLLFSCNNDSANEGISRITIYPTLELNGDADVFINTGDTL